MRYLSILLLLVSWSAVAQTQHNILPGESGATLLSNLLSDYKPATLLSESATKDVMMDEIYRDNNGGPDGVFGVYTHEFIPFDGSPSSDPNQDIFNNGAGLNQEHVWPRSQLGGSAAVPSERDMHHLVPTGVEINADRGSFPFAEIPDNLTTTWYRFDDEQSTIPDGSIIDEFSELRSGNSFEPREDFKGNVARMMFYIATMYPTEANMSFFSASQQSTLYNWHYADPVDQIEYDRTFLIGNHQSNSPNPFVMDSTLIRRAFFPHIVVSNTSEIVSTELVADVFPNPFQDTGTVDVRVPQTGILVVELFDALGRRLATLHEGNATAGQRIRVPFNGNEYRPGLYMVRISSGDTRIVRRIVKAR